MNKAKVQDRNQKVVVNFVVHHNAGNFVSRQISCFKDKSTNNIIFGYERHLNSDYDYYPEDWYSEQTNKIKPEKEELIKKVLNNGLRSFYYSRNNANQSAKVLDLNVDEHLIEYVTLCLSEHVRDTEIPDKKTKQPVVMEITRTDIVKKKEVNKYKVVGDCHNMIATIIDNMTSIKKILWCMGINTDTLSDDSLRLELYKKIEINPEGLLKELKDTENREFKSVLERALQKKYIEFIKGNGYYFGEIQVGTSKESCINFLKNKKNAKLTTQIFAKVNGFSDKSEDTLKLEKMLADEFNRQTPVDKELL